MEPQPPPYEETPGWSSSFLAAALRVEFDPERAREAGETLSHMMDLAAAGRALDLRLARLLSWFKHQDLAPLGYSSFYAFCREKVDWGGTWVRKVLALVESDLQYVKALVCQGRLSMSVAVQAPGRVAPADEMAWLLYVLDEGDPRHWGPWPDGAERRGPEVEVQGEDVRVVHEARNLARLCLGWPAPDPVADDFVRECWRARRPGEEVLAQAREAPPAPDGEPPPPWCDEADPATALVGPWQEPAGLQDGLRILEDLLRARRTRVVELGRCYERVAQEKLHLDVEYRSVEEMARKALGMDVRTLQRYRRLAQDMEMMPELGQAVGQGLDLERAEKVAEIASEETVGDWLEVARRVPVAELGRAVALAGRELQAEVLAAYRAAMAAAPEATDSVALRAAQAPQPAPRWDRVHRDQAEAARRAGSWRT